MIALEAVARAGSFMRAASALGYSQSAISQQIAALESVAGVKLLTRGAGLAPTSAGEIVLRRARSVRQQLASLDAELDALTSPSCDVGQVVTHHPAATSLFADALRHEKAQLGPGPLVVKVATSFAALLHALEAGTTDLAFAAVPPVIDAALVVEPLVEDALGVVSSASLPSASARLALTDISGSRLLCLSECPATERLLCELVVRDIPHEVSVRADDAPTLLELARRGHGVALLPRLSNYDLATDLLRYDLAERFSVVVVAVWCALRPPTGECAQILDLVRGIAAMRSASI